MAKKERRYWDSNAFLSWHEKTEGQYDKCLGVIDACKKGEVEIITSALTLAEVIYLKGYPKITPEKSETICRFFENEFIRIINVDRVLAEDARNLLWDHLSLKAKDAIHVASAIKAKAIVLDTFDEGLIKLSGKMGDPLLRISHPDKEYQEEIEFKDDIEKPKED